MSKTPEAYGRILSTLELKTTSRATTLELARIFMPNKGTVRDINLTAKPRIYAIIGNVRDGAQADNAIIDQEGCLLRHARPTRQCLGFLDQLRGLWVENEEQVANCDNFMKWVNALAIPGELDDEDEKEQQATRQLTLPMRGPKDSNG